MRIRRHPIPLSLAIACLASVAAAVSVDSLEHIADLSDGKPGRGSTGPIGPSDPLAKVATVSSSLPSKPTNAVVVAKDSNVEGKRVVNDAPVDGKDGKPHQGPFVETQAERERKSSGKDDELPITAKKPGPKESADSEGYSEPVQSNDGVMDDPNRAAPKLGTTGTEGKISEKSRERQGSLGSKTPEKTPEEPKEVPPLPHSEQEKLSAEDLKELKKNEKPETTAVNEDDDDNESEDTDLELGGMKKPDLPDKPHDIPHPVPNSGAKDALEVKNAETFSTIPTEDPSTLIQPLHSFFLAFTMILFSEIGDKTFLVAALMAMKHPPLLVFSAAFPALLVMTVGSALFGHAVPTLLPVKFTNLLAAILFLVFGLKMLREGYAISPDEGVGEEMREVEMELEEKEQLARREGRRRSPLTPYMLESGRGSRSKRSNSRLPTVPDSPPSSPDERSPSPSRGSGISSAMSGVNNLFSLLLSPAWVQTFVMTFLGEWGDRSQIATIAMAAGQDYWWVTSGAIVGHSICTGIAVIGGRAIAGRVSLKVVTLGGAFAFLIFGIIYLAEALYYK